MKSYVCEDQRGDHESECLEIILSALGDGLPGLSIVQARFSIPSLLWPPFNSAPALNQCTPTIQGKGGFIRGTEPLDTSYTDQQPKAQGSHRPLVYPSISLVFNRGFYPTDTVHLSEHSICVKRKFFHTKAVSTVISVAFNDGSMQCETNPILIS